MEDGGNNTNSDMEGTDNPLRETARSIPVPAILLGLLCALIGGPIGMQMGLDAGEHPPLFSLCSGLLIGGLGGVAIGTLVNRITQFPPKPLWESKNDKRYRTTIIIAVLIIVAVVLAWVFFLN